MDLLIKMLNGSAISFLNLSIIATGNPSGPSREKERETERQIERL